MCRLIAITSEDPISPMVAIEALDVMREGHDGSGTGLFLRDLGGPFEEIKDALGDDLRGAGTAVAGARRPTDGNDRRTRRAR